MKIYLDYIFLENVIVNLIITLQINYFTKLKNRKINVAIGVLFISIYTTIIYVLKNDFLNSVFIKLVVICIYAYITFVPKTIVKYFKNIVYYLLFSFLYIGIIIAISLLFNINLDYTYIKIIIYVISSFVMYIFFKYVWKMWKTNIKESDFTYNINIEGTNIISFVDTGNTVKDLVTNLNVIFVKDKYKDKLVYYLNKNKKVEINIGTINNVSKEIGYIFKNVSIYKDKKYITTLKKIIICFVNNNFINKEYDGLIGYETYTKDLKGVLFC